MTFAQQRVIGRYVLGDAIAAGGMATVHFGRLLGPAGFSRTVAIKQLRPGLPSDEESLANFLDEARLASRIHHPNVVSPSDVVLIGNEAFIVMDYVHGESLSRLLKAAPGKPVSPALAAAIIGQVLLGLHAAHRAVSEEGAPLELVHRDVSPQNILITPDGVARLLDFGIAKAVGQNHQTLNGVLKGKLAYMAPEQVTSAPIDRRTDLFAAGTVLWEMLTGQRLFLAETPAACVQKILHDRIAAPSELVRGVPPGLDEVVSMALARDPDDRFPDAQAMAVAVASAVRPASALEVGSWVTELCGEALLARHERIADFEAAPLEELTLGLPSPGFGVAGTPGPFVLPKVPLARSLPEATSVTKRPVLFRRRAALVAAAVLTFGTLSVAGPRAMQRFVGNATPSAPPQRALTSQVLASAPAASPRDGSSQLKESEPTVSAPPELVRLEGSRRSALPVRHRAPPESVEPARSTAGSGGVLARPKPAQKITSVPTRLPQAPQRSPVCEIPYTIDERGVKRFNPDCL